MHASNDRDGPETGGVRRIRDLLEGRLSDSILGAAVEVHRTLGPGLLESVYEECLATELAWRRVPCLRQVALSLHYKGRLLREKYRIDLLVADAIIVELKCVETILPVHEAQLLTYMRQSRKSVGLLLNFNVSRMKDGIVRRVL